MNYPKIFYHSAVVIWDHYKHLMVGWLIFLSICLVFGFGFYTEIMELWK